MTDHRSVLMEIPEPQAKLTGRLRRSYMDILCSRPALGARCRKHLPAAEPGLALNGGSRWLRSSRRDTCQASASRELLDTLTLAEQSVQVTSSSLTADLKILLEDLHQKKASVYRSIPYSRLGSNRDAHCYRKAQPHLMAFKRSCLEGGRMLLQRAEWQKVLEFVLVACRYVSELPRWENSSHNMLPEQCYRTLADVCNAALQKHRPVARRARQLLHRFKTAPGGTRGARPCLRELEEIVMEYQRKIKP